MAKRSLIIRLIGGIVSRSIFIDAVAATGFGSLVYGCSLVYPAAGWIVGGSLALWYALAARRPELPESGVET